MKVLFAVNDEKDAEAITRVYQKEYKEIISSKTVYYFNAIIKELQKDKTYDRIVISEDLEMFSSDNYQAVDKFIFEKMDAISDEATNAEGNDIPIILLCMDRRTKSDPLLVKLFGLGLYNVLIGQDRSIQKVAGLMYKPRTKKEAKAYYRVEAENVSYSAEEKNGGVNESEIQNILNHYKKIGDNVPKCVQSFESIMSQYSKDQMKLIAQVLPKNTKVILEENSDSYRKLMGIKGKKAVGTSQLRKTEYVEKELDLGNRLTQPVIIPTAVNTKHVNKVLSAEEMKKKKVEEAKAKQKLAMEKEEAKILEKKKAMAEAKRKAELEAKRKAEEEARKIEEERIAKERAEAKRKAEEEARRKAEEEAKRKAEEEARRKAEEEAKRKAEEEARRKAEEEARRKAEEEAKRKAEEEARRKAEEEARRKAEEEAKRKAEEEAKKKAEEAKIEAKKRLEKERAEAKARIEAKRKEEERIAKEKEESMRKEQEKMAEEKLKVENDEPVVKRGRGRPRKSPVVPAVLEDVPVKRKRGRPRKNPIPEEVEASVEDVVNDNVVKPVKKEEKNEIVKNVKTNKIEEDDDDLFDFIDFEDVANQDTADEAENEVDLDLYDDLDDEENTVTEDLNNENDEIEEDDDIDALLPGFDDYKEDDDYSTEDIDEIDESNNQEDVDDADETEYVDDDEYDNYYDDDEFDFDDYDDYTDSEDDSETEINDESKKNEDEDEEFLPGIDDEEDYDDGIESQDNNYEEDSITETDDETNNDKEDDYLPGFDEEDDDDDDYDFLNDENNSEAEDEESDDTLLDLDDDEAEVEDEDNNFEDYDFDDEDDYELENDDNEEENSTETNSEEISGEEDDYLPGFDEDDDDYDFLDEENDSETENDDDTLPGLDDNEAEEDDDALFELDDEEAEEDDDELPGLDDEEAEEDDDELPGLDDEEVEEDDELPGLDDEEEVDEDSTIQYNGAFKGINNRNYKYDDDLANSIKDLKESEENTSSYNIDTDNLITSDQKVVAFVGTSKNGTSFIINNLAEMYSNQGIQTAILDLTKNKNAYYVYTNNEEELREKAHDCFEKLSTGIADGIKVNNNLTVYTSLPGEDDSLDDVTNIIKTLLENYTIVLLDCDFETDARYFKIAQELYLVQSWDVLTIQPLTAFLRDLKVKNILETNKLRIIINKDVKIGSISEKALIGGMSSYSDPAMTYMTELFNRDTIKYATIPFDSQVYSKYLEGIANCKITTKGYSKSFISSMNRLSDMVYPKISGKNSKKQYNDYSSQNKQFEDTFSKDTSSVLNKMKKKY